jgi:hypothetical protein
MPANFDLGIENSQYVTSIRWFFRNNEDQKVHYIGDEVGKPEQIIWYFFEEKGVDVYEDWIKSIWSCSAVDFGFLKIGSNFKFGGKIGLRVTDKLGRVFLLDFMDVNAECKGGALVQCDWTIDPY